MVNFECVLVIINYQTNLWYHSLEQIYDQKYVIKLGYRVYYI